jgi:predicted aminopeptidase
MTQGTAVTRSFFRIFAALSLLTLIGGCTSIPYYAQSLDGHLKLMTARQDVERLIRNPATPAPLRNRMAAASEIRAFASEQLDLPDNDSYRSYVDIDRDYVTWAVFAAPELSLVPRTECFPVFGCVPYRGYFAKEDAAKQALALQKQGFDVHISGINAYSTLGLTSDPLLSTMFRYDRTYLASVVFHELAHQRVYVKGDSAFNEAFAVTVETTGVRKWLRANRDSAGLRVYEAERRRQDDFLALVGTAKQALQTIYAGAGTIAEKRAAKAAAIEDLRKRYRRMRDTRWDGDGAYDAWFESPINNAKLGATAVYNDLVPAFMRLFETCGENYPRFYDKVRQIGDLDPARKSEALEAADSCR